MQMLLNFPTILDASLLWNTNFPTSFSFFLTWKGSGEMKSFPVTVWTLTQVLWTMQTVCSKSSPGGKKKKKSIMSFCELQFELQCSYSTTKGYRVPSFLFWGTAKGHHKACRHNKRQYQDPERFCSKDKNCKYWKLPWITTATRKEGFQLYFTSIKKRQFKMKKPYLGMVMLSKHSIQWPTCCTGLSTVKALYTLEAWFRLPWLQTTTVPAV